MTEREEIPTPQLVTDCSAPGVRAGILGNNGWLSYQMLEGETGAVLFQAVKQLLSTSQLSLKDIRSFAYCEGPGSTLGIRINAMALRTWISLEQTTRPVFAYRSLDAATNMVNFTHPELTDFSILSDFRKHAWNGTKVVAGSSVSKIEVVTAEDIEAWPTPRYFIQQRIHSPGLPPDTTQIDYDLEPVGNSDCFWKLLRLVENPGVFQTTNTEFKKWVPSRHR